ncbi:MAG: AraC family transcriptional regulator [Lachnospiraceae bacterium]|nr:AraC family transcriptional regulator [Lachnospiraceae bacterium]
MPDNLYKQNYDIHEQGILIEYKTTGDYLSAHWHDSLELVYILNGNADFFLEGTEHKLVPGEFIVTDANQIHEARCTHTYMMIVLRYDDDLIQRLMGNKRNFQIICSRAELTDELVPAYLEICECLKKLAPLHVKQPKGYLIAEQSIALDILYRLIKDFSIPLYKEDLPEPSRNQLRIKEIVSYIDKHYMESLSLEQIADVFGLNSAYFSRMFRQNIGIPFTQHVNHVRLTHIYHDICTTDEPVLEILDKHGFTNYKLFSRMFKEMYGDTPREIRRRARLEQMA